MESYRLVAARFDSNTTDLQRDVVKVLNGVMTGKTNNRNTVTLTANVVTTVVTLSEGIIGNDTVFLFSPTTSNAALEQGAGTMYLSSRSIPNNTFTLTHANNAQADRTFTYVFIG